MLGTTKVAVWNANTQQYRSFETDPFDLAPGVGAWARYAASHTVVFDGQVPAEATSATIVRDWNLLANPHLVPLPWVNVTSTCSVQAFAWTLNSAGTGYLLITNAPLQNTVDAISPWGAFWIRSFASGACDLSNAAPASAGDGGGEDTVAWAIQLSAAAGDAEDRDNFVGLAKAGGGIQADNPPAIGSGYVDLYSVGSDEGRSAVDLVGPGADTSWDLVAETDIPNTTVEIRFPDLSSVPSDLSVMLQDVEAGRDVNMRTARSYSFTSGDSGARRELRIEVRPRADTPAVITSATARASGGGIDVVYSLSAGANVDVVVHNIAGREVARVDSSWQDAGTHTASWSGVGSSGTKAPSGRYLITVQCATQDGTQMTRVVSAQVR